MTPSRITVKHEPEDPAHGREERQEEMVEREHLVAQHGQPVEELGSLVVLDRRHRRLQLGDVGLECDADPVAEAALKAVEQHAQVPGAGRGDGQAGGGDEDAGPIAVGDAVGQHPQPERQEHVRQRGDHGHREGGHEELRLGPVAQLHRAPQRGQARAAGRQASVSWTTSSPCSSTSTKREAWRSNMVR